MSSRGKTLAITLTVVVVVAVGGFLGVRALFNVAKHTLAYPYCDVGAYELDPSQASVAAQMVGEVTRYSPTLPERAAVLALAAGLQESKLTNLPGGDRDSVGVLQQRPSQDWGNPPGNVASLMNVTEATREFLNHLRRIDGWETMDLATAVQAVQISADGSLYAQHEDEAQALADALQGKVPAGITCTINKPTQVATTAEVITALRAQLPVNTPTTVDKTITVPGAHWQTAAWFVANADRYGIDSVSYAGKTWTRAHQWRTSSAASSEVAATLATIK